MITWIITALKWVKDKLFSCSRVENNYGNQVCGNINNGLKVHGNVNANIINCTSGELFNNTVHLSYKERTVLEFFASGGYAVYALDEDGKIEQINLIGENKCADTAETVAINTLAQYGFVEKLIAPPHIVCTPAGHSFVRQGK